MKITIWLTAAGLVLASCAAAQDAKDVYLDKCSVCHGADGAGKTAKGRKLKVNDVRQMVGKMNEAEMVKVIENGKGNDMDAFGKDLNKDVIKAVAQYYRGLAK